MKPLSIKACPYCDLKNELNPVKYIQSLFVNERLVHIYNCDKCNKNCQE